MTEETTALALQQEIADAPAAPEGADRLLELMKKLEEASAQRTAMAKKQLRMTRLGTAFLAVMAVAVVVFVGVTMPRIDKTLNYADQALENLGSVTQELREADLKGLLANVDQMILQGQESLTAAESALKSIESIDIQGLNKAITDLRRIVNPLGALFGG